MYLLYCFSSVSSKTKRDAEPENPHGNDVISVIRHGFRLYQIRRTYYCKLGYCRLWNGDWNSFWVTARHVLNWCGSELSMDVRRFTFSSVSSCTEITATQARRTAVDETATCVQSISCGVWSAPWHTNKDFPPFYSSVAGGGASAWVPIIYMYSSYWRPDNSQPMQHGPARAMHTAWHMIVGGTSHTAVTTALNVPFDIQV